MALQPKSSNVPEAMVDQAPAAGANPALVPGSENAVATHQKPQ